MLQLKAQPYHVNAENPFFQKVYKIKKIHLKS